MSLVSHKGSKAIIGSQEIDFKFDLLDAIAHKEVAIILIDPDSYIGK